MAERIERKNLFFNRELSWIEFNARVLNEALRPDVPLLERLKFLAIVSSNFDEFFRVRVASIKRAERSEPNAADLSSMTPGAVLKKISERCHELTRIQDETLVKDILPQLKKAGVEYIRADRLSESQRAFAESVFRHDIFPVLTPLRTDGITFPNLDAQSLTAAFLLEQMTGLHTKQNPLIPKEQENVMALVPLPSSISKIIWLPSENDRNALRQFTTVYDVLSLCGTEFFPGYKVKESLMFKICRDADFAVDEDAGSNFIQAMEEVLVKRRSAFAVRILCTDTSETLTGILKDKLSLSEQDVYLVQGILDPNSLLDLLKIENAAQYLYPEWKNFSTPSLTQEETLWSSLRTQDILLNVPYESYEPVINFIRTAARDENVLAIKITLYRIGNDSPIVHALQEAAQNGKQVTAFMELKARFDEKRNISMAEELENSGVIVVYGVVGLKVHAKICLAVRKESDGIRRYVHLSTGNYNPSTAKTYQDFSLLTSNRDIANDATLFFNVISGYSAVQSMHNLCMAPVTLKSRLMELIDREIKQSAYEKPGMIVAKMNNLCHKEIIEKLYEASRAGVRIKLNVRGICALVPGVPGMSENIQVVSVVDRYLEHSRVIYFQNGGAEELYLSSADWMERNLDRRIELMFPIKHPAVFTELKENLFLYFKDNTHASTLGADGIWTPVKAEGHKDIRAQEELYRKYKKRAEAAKSLPRSEFTVRRKD